MTAIATILVAGLAGCAAPVDGPPSHHTATPTTSPTTKAADAAGSRVPVGCAKLLGAAALAGLAGAKAQVRQDEHSAPTNLTSAAQLQYGAEDCVWARGGDVSDTTPGAYLNIAVAPDAKAAFQTQFAASMSSPPEFPHPAATENVAGDQSGYWCVSDSDLYALGSDGPSNICDAEMLVNDYWVSIQLGDVVTLTRDGLTAGLATALTQIASGLKKAGAPPLQWPAPASAVPSFCAASTPQAVFAQTIGGSGRLYSCEWNSTTYGERDFDLLSGGSWAVSRLKPVSPNDADYGRVAYLPITVPGVPAALASCDGSTCDAYLAVGTSAVEAVYPDPGATKNPGLLAALATAITTG
jgi:hypothetical protein